MVKRKMRMIYPENQVLSRKMFAFILLLWFIPAQFILIGCDDARSRAKKIVSLKNERREMVDKLYAEYGGSELAKAVNEDIKKEQAKQGGNGEAVVAINELTRSVDQGLFENRVRLIGQGEKAPFMTEKAREFFSRPDVIKKCQKVYEIEMELQILEEQSAVTDPRRNDGPRNIFR